MNPLNPYKEQSQAIYAQWAYQDVGFYLNILMYFIIALVILNIGMLLFTPGTRKQIKEGLTTLGILGSLAGYLLWIGRII